MGKQEDQLTCTEGSDSWGKGKRYQRDHKKEKDLACHDDVGRCVGEG